MTSSTTPEQTLAEHARAAMYAKDAASVGLGILIPVIAPGYALATMTIRPDMLNGFGLCHGGFIITLADTAFAFACNSNNQMTLATGLDAEFLKPVELGDTLSAEARVQARASRLGVCDVAVRNQQGVLVTLVRGRSYTVKGKQVVNL
ncbi:MAG: hydroxyphenylacetyl-CoA thioesterase PaaI [Gammaproteobacteria bacterium]|nr:hydroxyphenylacetyl-CoA thioesterase PaaI [Gammaproteobacteria bacterium]